MGKIDGKVALITGGTTGIGFATAQLFQREGAQVIVTGQSEKTLDAARQQLDSSIEVVQSDAGSVSDINALISHIEKKYGHLDILFVNAGVANFAPLEHITEQFFDTQFAINVRGAYFVMQRSASIMLFGGSIILTASAATTTAPITGTVYSATKAALRSFGRTFAAELAPKNIRVNTISPGAIDTPIFDKLGMSPEIVKEWVESMKNGIPLKRFGQAQEIAMAALFFASQDSSYITGVELPIDGGMTQATHPGNQL